MFPGEKRWHRQRWPLGHSGGTRPSPGEASATFASAAASVSLLWAGSGKEAEMRGQRTPRLGEANGESGRREVDGQRSPTGDEFTEKGR